MISPRRVAPSTRSSISPHRLAQQSGNQAINQSSNQSINQFDSNQIKTTYGIQKWMTERTNNLKWMVQSKMKLASKLKWMKSARQAEHEISQDRSSESLELMPGNAKIGWRLKCEVRGQKSNKRKYIDTNGKQWEWDTSINIIMQWNRKIIMYQCWNWSNWAKRILQNVM